MKRSLYLLTFLLISLVHPANAGFMEDLVKGAGLSHTCFSGGMPKITLSGVPVKNMSPGFKVKGCDA